MHDNVRRRWHVNDVAVLLLRRRVVRDPLRQEVVSREPARVDQRRRQRRAEHVVAIKESVACVKRVVVSVSSFVRVRTLYVLVCRQVGRHQVRVEAGQTQNAEKIIQVFYRSFRQRLIKR